MIAGESLDPLVVLGSALAQYLLGDGADAVHVAEEMHDVFRAREQGQMAADNDPVKTVVYECQQAAKQLREFLHRSSRFCALEFAPRAWDRGLVEVKNHGCMRIPSCLQRSPALYRSPSGGAARKFQIFLVRLSCTALPSSAFSKLTLYGAPGPAK